MTTAMDNAPLTWQCPISEHPAEVCGSTTQEQRVCSSSCQDCPLRQSLNANTCQQYHLACCPTKLCRCKRTTQNSTTTSAWTQTALCISPVRRACSVPTGLASKALVYSSTQDNMASVVPCRLGNGRKPWWQPATAVTQLLRTQSCCYSTLLYIL